MSTTMHFRATDPPHLTTAERRALAAARGVELPLCGLCLDYHDPALHCRALRAAAAAADIRLERPATTTTRAQRTALQVPPPPSVANALRQSATLTAASTTRSTLNADGIAAPPSLFDAVRAARTGGQR